MSQTVEHLEKVLSDLVSNRGRLVEQINVGTQQLEVNQSQLEHFDTLIATTRHALGDSATIAKIEEIRNNPPGEEASQPPLADAGAGAAEAPAPAG